MEVEEHDHEMWLYIGFIYKLFPQHSGKKA